MMMKYFLHYQVYIQSSKMSCVALGTCKADGSTTECGLRRFYDDKALWISDESKDFRVDQPSSITTYKIDFRIF